MKLDTFSLCKTSEHSSKEQIPFLQLNKYGEVKYIWEERVCFRPQEIQYIVHKVRKKQANYQNV